MRRAERAGSTIALGQLTAQERPSLDHKAGAQHRLLFLRLKFHNRHRRNRAKIVRVNSLQKTLRKARELGIQLQMDARGQEGESFQQSLHIRVWADFLGVGQRKSSGNLGKISTKLGGRFAQVPQLDVVKFQQPFIHWTNLQTGTDRSQRPQWF